MTSKMEGIVLCPNCRTEISHHEPVHLVKRGIPRFKWWVSVLNMVFLSTMLVLIEFGADGWQFDEFQWSLWAIGGIWLIYGVGIILSFRPEDTWLLVPFFFILVCGFLALLDLDTRRISSDEPRFGLTWSYYPIIVILFLFVLMPLVSFMGRKQKKPVEMLREIIHLEEEHTG